MPTAELPSDSKLLDMLTYFMGDDTNTTEVRNTEVDKYMDKCHVIYSVNGQKQTELKRGVNVVVDSEGKTKKIIVR